MKKKTPQLKRGAAAIRRIIQAAKELAEIERAAKKQCIKPMKAREGGPVDA